MNNTIDRKKLSAYSAILAILVVLIHSDNTYTYASLADGSLLSSFVKGIEWLFSKNLASVAVPSFFMISGILFYRDFTLKKYPKKLKARFFSLIIPYLLWNLFRFVLFYLLGKSSLKDLLCGPQRIVFTWENLINGLLFYKYNTGFWFMYQLILFTILAPIIRALTKNKWVGLVTIISLVALFSTDLLGAFLSETLNKRFILLEPFIFYTIGAYIGTHFFDFVNRRSALTKGVSVFGVILGQALNFIFIKTNILLFYILFLIVSAVSFWYFYDILNVKSISAKITSITFFIYAAHGTVLEILQAVELAYLPNSSPFALLCYIVNPALTILILVGASILLKKLVPKFWSIINGAR